jgi:hypothetical protein
VLDHPILVDQPAALSLMVLPAKNLMVLPGVSAQTVGLNNADFEFRCSATRIQTLEPTGLRPDGPANTCGAAGRSEKAEFEFDGLRDQDSNLEPTG